MDARTPATRRPTFGSAFAGLARLPRERTNNLHNPEAACQAERSTGAAASGGDNFAGRRQIQFELRALDAHTGACLIAVDTRNPEPGTRRDNNVNHAAAAGSVASRLDMRM